MDIDTLNEKKKIQLENGLKWRIKAIGNRIIETMHVKIDN